jgi:hypothetical protein
MQSIVRRYNTVATGFYNVYRRFGTNLWSTPYEGYLLNITRVYFPKIAYQNNFEPEYTRTSNNAYIVLALIATTLVAARSTVQKEEARDEGHQ